MLISCCFSCCFFTASFHSARDTLGALPRWWLWSPLQASVLVLGGKHLHSTVTLPANPFCPLAPELNNRIPLWKLQWERHSCWFSLRAKRAFSCEGFWSTPSSEAGTLQGFLSFYGREEGINWGWSISRGSFKIWVLINGPPNTRWGFLLLRFRDHYPNKWSIRIPWNYSVLFLSVIHKKETFRIVLNGL